MRRRQDSGGVNRQRVIADLRELIQALDRRVPQRARTAEHQIGQDAAALKKRALDRIAQLERTVQ